MNQHLEVIENSMSDKSLAASVRRIRALLGDWTDNTLTIGKELVEVRNSRFAENPNRPGEFPGWAKWLDDELDIAYKEANKFIQIYEKFGDARGLHQIKALRVLRFLAADTVPESARNEAMDLSRRGEHITLEKAKEIADKHRLPGPKQANAQAKEYGRPILASDGYIYFGTDPDKAKEGEDRRYMVYGVRRAIKTLAEIQLTGKQFLAYAEPHQLWDRHEGKEIKHALRWLTSLDDSWDKWEG